MESSFCVEPSFDPCILCYQMGDLYTPSFAKCTATPAPVDRCQTVNISSAFLKAFRSQKGDIEGHQWTCPNQFLSNIPALLKITTILISLLGFTLPLLNEVEELSGASFEIPTKMDEGSGLVNDNFFIGLQNSQCAHQCAFSTSSACRFLFSVKSVSQFLRSGAHRAMVMKINSPQVDRKGTVISPCYTLQPPTSCVCSLITLGKL